MNNEMCGCNGTCGTEEKTSTAKGLVRINYKEDFELVVELLAGDKPYKLGDEDFRIDFIVMASHYTVGRTAGVCERCSVDGNKIRCFMDAHGLPPGELRAEVKVNTPDPNYADGSRLNVAIAEGTVVLVKDNTRFDGAVVKAAMSVALVDAYQLAKEHGYKGTIDEYYSTFSDVSALLESMRGVAEAEEAREVAEEERIKAEELRQKNRLVVDNEASFTSENPISNKAVSELVNEIFGSVTNDLSGLRSDINEKCIGYDQLVNDNDKLFRALKDDLFEGKYCDLYSIFTSLDFGYFIRHLRTSWKEYNEVQRDRDNIKIILQQFITGDSKDYEYLTALHFLYKGNLLPDIINRIEELEEKVKALESK